MEKQKISIVFEGRDGENFHVYLDGCPVGAEAKTEAERSVVEFWALSFFQLVLETLDECGVIKEMHRRPENDSEIN